MFAQRTMGLRMRVAYELLHLDRRFPPLAPVFRRLLPGAEGQRAPMEIPGEGASEGDGEFAVRLLRGSLARPATFFIAVCERE